MRRQRSFIYRGREVVMDAENVERWAKINNRDKLEIRRSVRLVYTAWLNELKAAEFKPTFEGIRITLTKDIQPGDKLPDIARKLDTPVNDDVLELLKFSRYRHWNKSPLRDLFCRAVISAAMDGDATFFKRLGRILERKPVPFRAPAGATPLEEALVSDWITDEGFCLCCCSDQAIADLLTETKYSCDFQAVRKARQRLRLRKPSLKLVTSVRRDGDRLLLS